MSTAQTTEQAFAELARQYNALVERVSSPRIATWELRGALTADEPPAYRTHREKEYTTDPARIRELLEEAVRMRAPVDVTYEDANGTFTRRDYSPSRVMRLGSMPHTDVVRGYCHARELPRTFRLDRIKALEVR